MQDPTDQVPQHLAESLETLKELKRRLDVEMNSGLAASKGAGANKDHVRMAMQLANASTQLSREARAWLKKTAELAKQAPLEDRIEAICRFVQDLPPSEKALLLERLRD